jgi:hypothetical protein
MRMHGFTADQLAELVRLGFAATTTEHMIGEWRQPLEVKRLKCSSQGRPPRRLPLRRMPHAAVIVPTGGSDPALTGD